CPGGLRSACSLSSDFPARQSSRQRARQQPHCPGGRRGETARLHARCLVHADLSSTGRLSQAGLRGRRAAGVRPARRDTYADDQEALRKLRWLFFSDNHALSCSLKPCSICSEPTASFILRLLREPTCAAPDFSLPETRNAQR